MNHRLANYKRAGQAIFWKPNPDDPKQGWAISEEGHLEPVWSCGPILPPSLVDILETSQETEVDDDDEEEDEDEELDEADFDEFFCSDDEE